MTVSRTRATRAVTERRPAPTGRRPALIAGVVLAGLLSAGALSACGSGQYAQTADQVAAVPGANQNAGPGGTIQLRNLLVQYSGPQGYAVGSTAPLVVRIFNAGSTPITLVSATADKMAQSVRLVGGPATGGTPAPAPSSSGQLGSKGAASPGPSGTPSESASSRPSASPSARGSSGPGATPSTGGGATPSTGGEATPTPTPSPTAAGAATFSVQIPVGGYALLVPGQGPYLQLSGLTGALTPGMTVEVTFRFSDGSAVPVRIPLGPPLDGAPRATPSPTAGE